MTRWRSNNSAGMICLRFSGLKGIAASAHSSLGLPADPDVGFSGSKSALAVNSTRTSTSSRRTSIRARRSKTALSAAVSGGWVIDLGANCGLFAVWAALTGAQVVAVEAQQGFAAEIERLAAHNDVTERVHVEVAMASGVTASGAAVGIVADDQNWSATSHGAPSRPADVSVPELMSRYQIDRVGLLKVDIEGGEFAVFADSDLSWLEQVDQLALEIHLAYGDTKSLIESIGRLGFTVELQDNDGDRVAVASPRLEYAYCIRQ